MSSSNNAAILIVGDRREILHPLLSVCWKHGLAAQGVKSGREAWSALKQQTVPIVMVAWRLPDIRGFRLMKAMKAAWPRTDIIALFTERDLKGKKTPPCQWASGSLVRPFGPKTVLACLCRTAVRQTHAWWIAQNSPHSFVPRTGKTGRRSFTEFVVQLGELTIDLPRCEVRNGGAPLPVTGTEFGVLAYLLKNAGRPVSAMELARAVRDPDMDEKRCVQFARNHVGRLRQKLEPDPSNPVYIITLRGSGYMVATDDWN